MKAELVLKTQCQARRLAKNIIYGTADYTVRLLTEDEQEKYPDSNYGVINKEYNIIEATVGVLYAGYAVADELQAKLNEVRPSVPHLSTVQ